MKGKGLQKETYEFQRSKRTGFLVFAVHLVKDWVSGSAMPQVWAVHEEILQIVVPDVLWDVVKLVSSVNDDFPKCLVI